MTELDTLLARAKLRRADGQPPLIGDGHADRDWFTLAEADRAQVLVFAAELERIRAVCWEPL